MPDRPDDIRIRLPAWLGEFTAGVVRDSDADKVAFAIDLAERNVERGAGGPFGAAVFEADSGRLIACGVNLVTPSGYSVAHAEILALCAAQQAVGSFDLSGVGCELATSCEPCAMCLGAVPWSGVSAVLCGARGEDARKVGFDEGDKPDGWVDLLDGRGIRVARDLHRGRARRVLRTYRERGGEVYNPAKHRDQTQSSKFKNQR